MSLLIASCAGCEATWTGTKLEHCTACHETFSGTWTGDGHRIGRPGTRARRCLTPDELSAKGWRTYQTARGVSVWRGKPPAEGTFRYGGDALGTPTSPPVATDTGVPIPTPRSPS